MSDQRAGSYDRFAMKRRSFHCGIAAALSLFWGANLWASGDKTEFNIIPKPSFLAASPGSFSIDALTSVAASGEANNAATHLAQRLRNATGF